MPKNIKRLKNFSGNTIILKVAEILFKQKDKSAKFDKSRKFWKVFIKGKVPYANS